MPFGNKRPLDEDSSNYAEELRDSDDDTNPEKPHSGAAFVEDEENGYHNLENAVQLNVHSGRQNKKYNANQVVFRARVDTEKLPTELQTNPLAAARESVRELFRLLIERSTEGLKPSDLIRFCIQSDGLDRPISTRLMPVSELTLEILLAAVLKVLQSKDQIMLDSTFFVDIVTLRRDVGAGRICKVVNYEVDRLRKQSILSIPMIEEGTCCAMSIVFALAHLQKNTKLIDVLRNRRRSTLQNRARELHVAAGVPIGPCTYAEVSEFEKHLDIQIVVISTDNLNKVSYKGPDREQRINLWLHNQHFDVIKSLKGFYASNFYCETCEKPYDHIEMHACPNACRICFRVGCTPQQPKRCSDCERLCQSEECYSAHREKKGQQQYSICDKIYQCSKCCKIIRRRECAREAHKCGTVKCPSCKNYVNSADHLCYLRTIPPKKSSDRLIYFDFETDQSSGEHIVNFAVAQYADGRENVFKGYTACSDFCSWFFSPEHKGYTGIAHNMKG
ncbi:uncharacterized protein LOC129218254 [Uloborus diversus]|uniref:uncharacterized protein LOC129218254 n=1 Tax=Uloborus diversus TaxID=327109 RepID=UPI0024099D9C|nr:uncharacterized protein LOC129218254 [Uloborus diversus]